MVEEIPKEWQVVRLGDLADDFDNYKELENQLEKYWFFTEGLAQQLIFDQK